MAKSKIRDFFSWSDDEVELLLKVTQEYKLAMAAQSTDWESSQSKYGDILERYREYYPSSQEAMATGKEFPHKKEELTKGQLTTKLKAIRFKYRQAVDSGRKRGHGRVILLYFELCDSIWGEAPVMQVLSEGIKTEDVQEALDTTSSAYGGSSSLPSEDGVAEDAGSAETAGSPCQRLNASLCGYRRNRLKRKLVMDSVTQEDLDIKRRLLQRLEATDDYFVQTMGHWSSTMDRLSDNIERLVQHIVCSGNNLPPHHTHPTTAPIPMDTQAQEGHS
ncbi:uncharacterized protein LOC133973462 [Platichthys flesus]|uniref:uncharacterized protein LOC133973462 n=1 Tax=Platichthys flesus TaxID=8260 RepID=UPI002DBC9371|nr:uncharacterized protein LOC133973462 [Platichthys flesus]